jgi:3-methyladenine DNA glycosylase/8-oxoguanine DNA glycosylase
VSAVATPRDASIHLAGLHPVMADLVDRFGHCRLGNKPMASQRFETLANAIVSQQLAGAAADTIWRRLVAGVGPSFTPAAVCATAPDVLRAAGLSAAKAASIVDLAQRVESGALDLSNLGRLPNEAVTTALTQVRGIGPWTADMFLIFALRRLDVWPTGDLGVRVGFGRAFSLPETPSAVQLAPLGDPFRPYRSVLAWYCWRAVEPPPKPVPAPKKANKSGQK